MEVSATRRCQIMKASGPAVFCARSTRATGLKCMPSAVTTRAPQPRGWVGCGSGDHSSCSGTRFLSHVLRFRARRCPRGREGPEGGNRRPTVQDVRDTHCCSLSVKCRSTLS